MSRFVFKAVQELRIHFCQKGKSSAGLRLPPPPALPPRRQEKRNHHINFSLVYFLWGHFVSILKFTHTHTNVHSHLTHTHSLTHTHIHKGISWSPTTPKWRRWTPWYRFSSGKPKALNLRLRLDSVYVHTFHICMCVFCVFSPYTRVHTYTLVYSDKGLEASISMTDMNEKTIGSKFKDLCNWIK